MCAWHCAHMQEKRIIADIKKMAKEGQMVRSQHLIDHIIGKTQPTTAILWADEGMNARGVGHAAGAL